MQANLILQSLSVLPQVEDVCGIPCTQEYIELSLTEQQYTGEQNTYPKEPFIDEITITLNTWASTGKFPHNFSTTSDSVGEDAEYYQSYTC
jgi:hypothetical protein